jgi:hypothetical protein
MIGKIIGTSLVILLAVGLAIIAWDLPRFLVVVALAVAWVMYRVWR